MQLLITIIFQNRTDVGDLWENYLASERIKTRVSQNI